MMLLRSFVIAFSMWSAIPMPQVEWDRDGMKYALCAFPFIGLAAGSGCSSAAGWGSPGCWRRRGRPSSRWR